MKTLWLLVLLAAVWLAIYVKERNRFFDRTTGTAIKWIGKDSGNVYSNQCHDELTGDMAVPATKELALKHRLDPVEKTATAVEKVRVAWRAGSDRDGDGYDDDEIVAMPREDFAFSRTTPKYGLATGLCITRDKGCQYRTHLQREWRTLRQDDDPNVSGHRWIQYRPLQDGDVVQVKVKRTGFMAHLQ